MTIADKAVLVTAANRGIGQALVAEALARGAKRSTPTPASPWPTPVLPAASPRGGQHSTARDS